MEGQNYDFQNGAWEVDTTADQTQSPAGQWGFYKAISPLLVVFRIYAVELTLGESRRRRRCFAALQVIYWVFQVSGFVVLFANFLGAGNDVKGVSYLATVVAATGVFFATILNLHIKKKGLRVLLRDIDNLVANFPDASKFCRLVYRATTIFVLFIFISSTVSIVKYYVAMLSGTDYAYGSQAYINGVLAQNETNDYEFNKVELFVYLWVAFLFFIYMAYICLFCIVLWGLNFSLKSLLMMNRRRRHGDVTTFLHLHCTASKLVRATDSCYREILLVWCIVELVCAVFAGRAANLDKPTEIRRSFLSTFIGMSALFLVKVLAASTANSRVMESLKEISFVDDLTIQDLSPSSTALAVRIKLYIQHIQISTPAITGWGLVVISKDVAVAAVGNILTYILVLYDK